MGMNARNFKTIAVIAICIAVVGLSVAYAALSQTLNIKTNATVQSSASSWNVKFVNPGTGTVVGTAVKGTITLTDTTVIASGIILKAPKDSVTYTFDVKNAGQVGAKLSTITPLTPSVTGTGDTAAADVTLVKANYTYTVTYADGSAIKANDTLPAGTTKSLKLVITYKDTATSLPSGNVTISNLGSTLVYVQA